MPNTFKTIVNLIKKTGDNCIVLDHEGNPAYVVAEFEKYEELVLGKSKLANLSENELLEKINRDIASWKAGQDAEENQNWQIIENAVKEARKSVVNEENSLNVANNSQESGEDEESDEKYYFEPID